MVEQVDQPYVVLTPFSQYGINLIRCELGWVLEHSF